MNGKGDGPVLESMSEPEAILKQLSQEKRRLYVRVLYSIAKDAIQAQCPQLKVMDLETLASLEEESNASFEEWLHSACI